MDAARVDCRRGAADRARERRARRVPRHGRAARRAAGPRAARTPVVAARTPEALAQELAAVARDLSRAPCECMVDWSVARRIADRSPAIAGRRRRCPATWRARCADAERARRRVHAARAADAAAGARGRRPRRSGSTPNLAGMRGDARPGRSTRRCGTAHGAAARAAARRRRPRGLRRGRGARRLPGAARARPVRGPADRPERPAAAAVRGAQPRRGGRRARRRPRRAAALGRVPRGHPRGPVLVGAVAARRTSRGCSSELLDVDWRSSVDLRRCAAADASTTRELVAERLRDGGAGRAASGPSGRRAAGPHPGDDGADRGPRRARHGRRRRRRAARPRRAARRARPPPARSLARRGGCSSGCSGSR